MRDAALGALGRNDPERIVEVDLAPRHVGGLAAADRRQEQEPRKRTGRVEVLGCLPEQQDLGIAQDTLARRHIADEVRDPDQGAWIARDLFAHHSVSEDRGGERERLCGRYRDRAVRSRSSTMVMASARVMRAASRLPQRGSRCWADRPPDRGGGALPGGGGRERKASASAAKLLAARCCRVLPGMDAGDKIADRGGGERPRLREADVGIAASRETGCGRPGMRRITKNEITPRSVMRTPKDGRVASQWTIR